MNFILRALVRFISCFASEVQFVLQAMEFVLKLLCEGKAATELEIYLHDKRLMSRNL